ncbi:MAG: hypothetical protein K0S65_4228 [Labilithrix sp.]|nr:hypothetical protein [Labilithrix sp.]
MTPLRNDSCVVRAAPVTLLPMLRTRRATASLLLTLGALGLVAACSSDDDNPVTPPVTEIDGGSEAASPSNDGITKLATGWNAIPGPEGTACSDGSPFSFYVRPGTLNRVVLEFSGGGACWDALTCGFASSLFSKNIDPNAMPWSSGATGIYNHDRADNPFRDWHHVFVPYCTGDVHWGANDADYSGTQIKHYGAKNTRAVLDWLYANLAQPEKMMTTGCSAGGYGSILWAPYVRQHYASAKHYQLSDSAVGAITDSFFEQIRTAWKFGDALPTFVTGLNDVTQVRSLDTVYEKIGAFYPDMPLSQFNTRYDKVQSAYFQTLGGGDVTAWSQKLLDSMTAIHAATPSFRSFVAPGNEHCIIPRDELYTATVGGKRVIDFVASMVNDQPIENVDCGSDCGQP